MVAPYSGRHVGDGRPVGQAQGAQSRSEELDEAADDPFGSEKAGDGQHQVGGGGARPHRAAQPYAHHLGNLERIGLAKQDRFRLDAAHAPAHDPKAIDHGGMGIGAEHAVRIEHRLAVLLAGGDHRGQEFKVHLMDDAGAGRHHPEVAKSLLAPVQHGVAFTVARHLQADVDPKRLGIGGRSTWILWSMTRSTGMKGFMVAGSPPCRARAERIAARSTRAGTPVKS